MRRSSLLHFLRLLFTFLPAVRTASFLLPATSSVMGGAPSPQSPTAAAAAAAKSDEVGALVAGVERSAPLPNTAPAATDITAATCRGADSEVGDRMMPSHLVVLSHGLSGTPEDLTYLKQSLERAGGQDILVHSARRNQGRTKDGVAEGGSRLAEEILEVVQSTPSLSRISLVGNSLGGLYVRYAAKLLYRDESGNGDAVGARDGATVAGLSPSVFMTIATPHLGVRSFTYVPIPSPLHFLAGVFVGKTGRDLFLSRNNEDETAGGGAADAGAGTVAAAFKDGRETALLYKMATSDEFLRPLKAFRWRRAYANRRGDFMVPYETAAFVEPDEGDGSDASAGEKVATTGAEDLSLAGTEHENAAALAAVEAGTGSFTIADRLLGAKHGTIIGISRVLPATGAGAMASGDTDSGNGDVDAGDSDMEGSGQPTTTAPSTVGASSGGPEELNRATARTGISARASAATPNQIATAKQEVQVRRRMEQEMAAGLNSCGWEKVSVDFGGLAPISHNKICALSRTAVTTALFRSGRSIVDHAAAFLISHDREIDADDDRGDRP